MKIEDIERKIKVHTDHISKLQKELEKEQSLIPLFVSPPLNIPTATENCLGWMCIAENLEYVVMVDKDDIYCFWWNLNYENIIKQFVRDDISINYIRDYNNDVNWFNIATECTRGIYKFTPHKDNTYSVTPLKINKDYTLSEV